MTTGVALIAFNGGAYLRAQLESIFTQTHTVDQVVVADDASTDETPRILDEFARAYPRRLRRLPAVGHSGVAGNVARALAAVSADVVFLSDQDDVWRPDKVARMLEVFRARPEALLAFSDARLVNADGRPLGQSLFGALAMTARERAALRGGEAGFETLLRRNFVTGATVALRGTLLDAALPVPAGLWHDEWLAVLAAARSGLVMVEECLIDYRRHAATATTLGASGVRSRVHKWLAPQGGRATPQARRLQSLYVGLQRFAPDIDTGRLSAVELHLGHWETLSRLPPSRWVRLPAIGRELWSGRYRRCARGWPSALLDMLRMADAGPQSRRVRQ